VENPSLSLQAENTIFFSVLLRQESLVLVEDKDIFVFKEEAFNLQSGFSIIPIIHFFFHMVLYLI
jgi:hypothetical protein